MQEWLAKEVASEDLERHDKWLCMMWPRLHLLRELLSDNGVIFVSIDDNEQHHLRMLMDEIFGAENFITCIAVVSNRAGSSDQTGFAGAHEYCLVYAKIYDEIKNSLGAFKRDLAEYDYQDEKGYYKLEQLQRGSLKYSERMDYPIFVRQDGTYEITDDDIAPVTGGPYTAVFPTVRDKDKAIWRWSKEKIREDYSEIIIERKKDGSIAIKSKQRPQTVKPKSLFDKPEYGTRAGGAMLKQIISDPNIPFPYPKAVALISDLLRIGAPDPQDIILDSFAGSGTTGHAVLALNQEENTNRRFILVECGDYTDDVTAERIRRVIKGVPDARKAQLRTGLDGSFTYCTLGDPIDIESMLTGESLPDYSTLATYLIYTASGISVPKILKPKNEDGLFYSDDKQGFYLLYEPSVEWLQSSKSRFNEDRAIRIGEINKEKNRKAIVFATENLMGQRRLTDWNITFCQLPYEIHHPKFR